MQTQIKKLQRISKFIDVNQFYNIGIDGNRIKLQGRQSPISMAIMAKYFNNDLELDSHGYLRSERCNIHIVLTPNY